MDFCVELVHERAFHGANVHSNRHLIAVLRAHICNSISTGYYCDC